jgi:hypothetical protein
MNNPSKSSKILWTELIAIKKDSIGIIISPHTLEKPVQILKHEINPYSEEILLNETDLDSDVKKWCSFSILNVWHKGIFRVINEHSYKTKKYYILELIYLPMDVSSTLKIGDKYAFHKVSGKFRCKGIDCRIHFYLN